MMTPQQRREIEEAVSELENRAIEAAHAQRRLPRTDGTLDERLAAISQLPEAQAMSAARRHIFSLLDAVTDYSTVPSG